MPLDAEEEAVAEALDRLDHPVGGPRDGPQALAEAGDRLVVQRVDLEGLAAEGGAQGGAAATRTPWVTRPMSASWRWARAPSTHAGRCWWRVPPVATLIIWAPRQIPSSGRSRSMASITSARSKASSSASVGPSISCAACP